MIHAIALLRKAILENREACFELSHDGDPVGSERAGYIADDCRKALEILEPLVTSTNQQTDDHTEKTRP